MKFSKLSLVLACLLASGSASLRDLLSLRGSCRGSDAKIFSAGMGPVEDRSAIHLAEIFAGSLQIV